MLQSGMRVEYTLRERPEQRNDEAIDVHEIGER